ncbi:hypothetical protein F4604DRAFT_1682804 [Suillus subluteus]|nr:hypothetical protein F4604DRAFT_1682804 [Suillus subluteus]
MVMQYHPTYEPDAISRKEGPPWYQSNLSQKSVLLCEHFVRYEGNKATCLYGMYLSSMLFYCKSNRKIYQDFKEEVCLRSLKLHYNSGMLNTSHRYNVQEKCKKIRGVLKIAALMMEGIFYFYNASGILTKGEIEYVQDKLKETFHGITKVVGLRLIQMQRIL